MKPKNLQITMYACDLEILHYVQDDKLFQGGMAALSKNLSSRGGACDDTAISPAVGSGKILA